MNEATETIVAPQDICYRAFELIREKQYDAAEKLLGHWLNKTEETVARALFHSAYGVLEKARGQYKAALRHYERAEKLLPDDPAIKLVTAQLLIDVFRETDRAIRKCRQAETLLPQNPVLRHHARTLEGMAYATRGERRKATDCLVRSLEGEFAGFLTCDNINFLLLETFVKKDWEPALCRRFFSLALVLAKQHQEDVWTTRLTKMLEAMPLAPQS